MAMHKKPVYFGRFGGGVIEAFATLPFAPAWHFLFGTARENVKATVFGEGLCEGGKFIHALPPSESRTAPRHRRRNVRRIGLVFVHRMISDAASA
jgi:hypothetical protein